MLTQKDMEMLDKLEVKGLTVGSEEEKIAVFRGMSWEELLACSILLQGLQAVIENKACISDEEKQKLTLIKVNLGLIQSITEKHS